ncbi:MAG: cytochrome c-type biogenesis protein CcmH [Actinobacteria bacterium]|nr:cytochrome c-type biogenesis protein CcmH [Actinomycetota bacterium]
MASPRWQRFKQGPGWILLGVVVVALMAIGLGQASDELSPEERIEAISKRLACPICDGESVFESRNNASEALRNEIRAQVDGGVASDDEIITFIEQRYGAQVLLVPRADGIDALVWILPVVALVCGVAGLAFAFRRWKRAGGDIPTDDDRALVAEARRAGLDADGSPGRPTPPEAPDAPGGTPAGEVDGDGS